MVRLLHANPSHYFSAYVLVTSKWLLYAIFLACNDTASVPCVLLVEVSSSVPILITIYGFHFMSSHPVKGGEVVQVHHRILIPVRWEPCDKGVYCI